MIKSEIPSATNIQSVDLRVRDLKTSLDFYMDKLGLKEVSATEDSTYLSSNDNEPYLIKLSEDKNASVRQRGAPGLYHLALLFPNRKELARVFLRLFNNKIKFQGFSDHLVSEAIYLSDPDGNGIELYADKPEDQWVRRFGEVEMDSLPLDLSVITNELDDREVWNGIHSQTVLGHIHLDVSDLNEAEKFYNELLGFKISNSTYPGAKFYAAGDYHHHVGTNIWSAKREAVKDQNALGLTGFKIKIPDKDFIRLIEQRSKESGVIEKSFDNSELIIRDYDGNKVSLVN